MREINVVVRCDRCMKSMDIPSDKPVDKWVLMGATYRTELCPDCQTEVMDLLPWLTPATSGGGTAPRRGRGKYKEELSPCTEPGCERVFSTKAGLAQHLSQKHRGEGRWGKPSQSKSETDRPGDEDGAYPCEFCGDVLPSKSGRGGHERSRHYPQWQVRKRMAQGGKA